MLVIVISSAAALLIRLSFPPPAAFDLGSFAFWVGLTLVSSFAPVNLPGGVLAYLNTAPLLAALFDTSLVNPFAVCWVAFLGTFGLRDFKRHLPWYGTLYNRANWVLSAYVGWLALSVTSPWVKVGDPYATFAQILIVGAAFATANNLLSVIAASVRQGSPFSKIWALSVRNVAVGLLGQIPLGWLMAQIAIGVGYWATLPFLVPLLLARYTFTKYAETRDLFFGTVSALSQAIDAKDGFTRGHADRVSRIAGAIAREMGLSEAEIERIELAGLLHDIGKIGVEDRILMKPMRLDADETELMRRHPIYGASILEPSAALRPLVQMVLHHHENFDGSGYPEGLRGELIPLGSRIIIVADAYEAMTSDRIYRKAIGHDKALEQLSKYKGIQFDPKIVRAIEQLLLKRGPDAFEVSDLPPINYETLAELRRRLAREPLARDAHAG
ncbi:MAG TPA: HD-GYP domain-containing protein [Candidatus Limnocylindria bacterium]|nr:HD-GYP domain-containing protein [Candidatus Limnocylindria bacterium]